MIAIEVGNPDQLKMFRNHQSVNLYIMKKKKSKKLLALQKSNIAHLTENRIEDLKGGSSHTTTLAPTTCITVTLFSVCTSIACVPSDADF